MGLLLISWVGPKVNEFGPNRLGGPNKLGWA